MTNEMGWENKGNVMLADNALADRLCEVGTVTACEGLRGMAHRFLY